MGLTMAHDQSISRTDEWPSRLRAWASLGASLLSRPHHPADWSAARLMIEAVRPKLAAEAAQLKQLLRKSRERLSPLEDPFDVDLGLHRWLDTEREESYSDWLAWVIKQAATPKRVFKLFGLGSPPPEPLKFQDVKLQRECCVPHGHTDQEGRLDLVIRYGNRAVIVLELKKGDAEGADTDKHEGYIKWLNQQDAVHKYSVFLATSAEDDMYGEFSFLPWADVCIEMRLLAIDFCRQEPPRVTAAALVLAFVAAIEQNLLGFSAEVIRKTCDDRAVFFNAKVVDHMKRFIDKLEI
jgi:hypothetical protein